MNGLLLRRALACTYIAVLSGRALIAPTAADATPGPGPARVLDLGDPLGGGFSFADAVDGQGDIAGTANLPDGSGRAVLWSHGQVRNLGVVAPYDESFAHGVADDGTVVGELDRNEQDVAPFVYRHGRMRILPGLGGDFGYASKINSRGVITGTASDAAANPHAVLWTDYGAHVTDLGIAPGDDSSFGTGVSRDAVVAGDTDSGSDERPALFARGRVLVLRPSSGDHGAAESVNKRGRVVGLSFAPDGIQHAQVWDSHSRPATDLGTLPGGTLATLLSVDEYGRAGGGGNTGADSDQVHAIIWPGHGPLLTLRPLSGRTADDFSVVRELGAHGEAVGASQDADGHTHATVWIRAFDQTVVPAPAIPSSSPTSSARTAILLTAEPRTLTWAGLSR